MASGTTLRWNQAILRRSMASVNLLERAFAAFPSPRSALSPLDETARAELAIDMTCGRWRRRGPARRWSVTPA
jgi:hypothetical protein